MEHKSLWIKLKLDSPIRKNILSNIFGVLVNLIGQIVLVPFYIIYWGNDLYSDWIVISAVTSFFSMTDIGLNTVIQNRFSIKYAEGDIFECKSLLTSNIIIVSFIFLLMLTGCIIFVSYFDIVNLMSLNQISEKSAKFIFIALVINVFIMMYSGIENSIYRATHKAAKCYFIDNMARLAIVVITFICVVTKLPLTMLVTFIILPNIGVILYKRVDAQKIFKYSFNINNCNWALINKILLPSVSFLSFPLGNAIILQGYTLFVNKYFGADSVVLYNTTRTLCNFIKTLLSTIQNSVWPEYSIAYGEKNIKRMRNLLNKVLVISILLSVVISVFLLIGGKWLYTFWTHGKIQFDFYLMLAFLIVLFFNNIWNCGGVALMATNNHSKLGILYIVLATISILMAKFIYLYVNQSIVSTVYSMLVCDLLLTVYAIKKGYQYTYV